MLLFVIFWGAFRAFFWGERGGEGGGGGRWERLKTEPNAGKRIWLQLVQEWGLDELSLEGRVSGKLVTWGPCSTPFLKGSPTTRFKARALAFSANSSYMRSCANVGDPAAQHWPCKRRLSHTRFCQSYVEKYGLNIPGCYPGDLNAQTWLKNKAYCASSTARSTSASSHTMKGDFPPSSKVTGLRLLFEANLCIFWTVQLILWKQSVRVKAHHPVMLLLEQDLGWENLKQF